jgi:hypothetical protein
MTGFIQLPRTQSSGIEQLKIMGKADSHLFGELGTPSSYFLIIKITSSQFCCVAATL